MQFFNGCFENANRTLSKAEPLLKSLLCPPEQNHRITFQAALAIQYLRLVLVIQGNLPRAAAVGETILQLDCTHYGELASLMNHNIGLQTAFLIKDFQAMQQHNYAIQQLAQTGNQKRTKTYACLLYTSPSPRDS